MGPRAWLPWVAALLLAGGCGDDAGGAPDAGDAMAGDAGPSPRVAMRLQPDGESFYATPYPIDLRLDVAAERVDLSGFPNPISNELVGQVLSLAAEQREGFGVLPVVSFGFDGPIDAEALHSDIFTLPEAPHAAFFVNVDADHPRHGERIPAVTLWFSGGGRYVDENVLSMAPWPGRSLAPGSTYAAVVRGEVGDAEGRPLVQSEGFASVLAGDGGGVARGEELVSLYAPLVSWAGAQEDLSVDGLGAATVFSTGRPVERLHALVEQARERFSAEVVGGPVRTHTDPDYCFFEATLRLPQFQQGSPPFEEAGTGLLALDDAGQLLQQREADVPFVLVVPRNVPMPEAGFPYLEYVHGSGGIATQVVDRGPVTTEGGSNEPWRGPGWVAARRGLASGGHAMPVSPDRVPGASSFEYLQLGNVGSLRGNFRQGTIELALKRDLLDELTLDAAECPDVETPGGTIRFDPAKHAVMGQSMGAMYANMFGAVSDEVRVVVPTGSGGYWSFFLFGSSLIPGVEDLLRTGIGVTRTAPFAHTHPVMGLFQQYVDAVDPIVFVPRLVRDPLPAVRAKHLYVPFGTDDSYFTAQTQRAMSVGYGIPRVGAQHIEDTDVHVGLFHDLSPASYPVQGNMEPSEGAVVTAAQVQYVKDPIQENGHVVAFQLEQVKHQYGCVLETFAAGETPLLPAPSDAPFAACE